MIRLLFSLGAMVVFAASPPAIAQLAEFAVPLANRSTSLSLSLIEGTFADGRITLTILVAAPTLLSDLDADLRARGKLVSGAVDLKWEGPTQVISAEASGPFVLNSKVRLVYPIGNDGKAVDIFLDPVWHADTLSLGASVTLANIRDFPGEIEQWLQREGVSFTRAAPLVALGDTLLSAAKPAVTFGQGAPTADTLGMTLPLTLSFSGKAAVLAVVSSLPSANPAASLFDLIFAPGSPSP